MKGMPSRSVSTLACSLLLSVVFVGSLAFAVQPADIDEMPRTLRAWPEAQRAAWVDARAAFTPAGELDLTLFHFDSALTIRHLLASSEKNGCIQARAAYLDNIHPEGRPNLAAQATLEDAAKEAEVGLSARVVGRSYGFWGGTPGQLLRIQSEEFLKGAPQGPKSFYYIFLPVAEFRMQGKRICKTDPRYGSPPNIGERIIVLSYKPGGENNEILDVADTNGVVSFHADGHVDMPPRYRESDHSAPTGNRAETELRERILRAIRKSDG